MIAPFDEEDGRFLVGTDRFVNLDTVYTGYGAELDTRVFPVDGLDLYANLDVQQVRDDAGAIDGSTSMVKANLGALVRTPWRVDLAAHLNYSSAQTWPIREFDAAGAIVVQEKEVPARTIVVGRVGVRPFGDDRLELAVNAWNLLALISGEGIIEHPKGQEVSASDRDPEQSRGEDMLRTGFLALTMLGCGWEAPVIGDGEAATNVITGNVVVNAPEVSGPALVLLYDAFDPPPPEGTGRPINLASVAEDAFSGGDGVLSAPFALTGVPAGTWLVTALLDQDQDFHPLIDATAGSTCGDMLGAYLSDITTGTLGSVTVDGCRSSARRLCSATPASTAPAPTAPSP